MKRKSVVISVHRSRLCSGRRLRLYVLGMQRGMGMIGDAGHEHADSDNLRVRRRKASPGRRRDAAPHRSGLKAGDVDPATGKKILY